MASSQNPSEGKLKVGTKAPFSQKYVFPLGFCCLRKLSSWLYYTVLCFYNLYSGKFKIFENISHVPAVCLEQKIYETDLCLNLQLAERNPNLLKNLSLKCGQILDLNSKGL